MWEEIWNQLHNGSRHVLFIIALDTQNVFLFFFFLVVVFLMFLVMHVYISTLWHISSAMSVVEPVYEFAAMRKSYELLEGKIGIDFVLVFVQLAICGAINVFFRSIVVHGGDYYWVLTRILVGGFLVGLLVIVNSEPSYTFSPEWILLCLQELSSSGDR